MMSTSMRFNRLFMAALLPAVLFVAGCGSGGTKFAGTWTNPEYVQAQDVDQVLVVAVSDKETNRRIFESTMVQELQREGVTAYPSTQFHPSVEQLSEAAVDALIKEHGIEAVIVTRLLDVDREQVVVPPSSSMSMYPSYGSPYYGSMYGYYSHGYSVSYDPGYSYESVTVTLETNLYDAANGELIWSGQSNTFDPGSVQDVIGPTTQIIVGELMAMRLLSPGK